MPFLRTNASVILGGKCVMVGEENNSRMECVVVELVIDSTKFLGNAKTSYFPELFLLNNNFKKYDQPEHHNIL